MPNTAAMHAVGWVLVVFGTVMAIAGLWWSYRALRIEHDNPSVTVQLPELAQARVAIRTRWNWLRRRPTNRGELHGVTKTISTSWNVHTNITADGSVWKAIADDDDLETKVAKLVHNVDELASNLEQQAKRQSERMVLAEEVARAHSSRLEAIELGIADADARERERKTKSLPNQVRGLVWAVIGQILAFIGAVLLAT